MDTPVEHRFYGELAPWWPLLSPPEDYVEEAADAARVLRSASIGVHDVLEIGSGGGNNAAHLRAEFTMTLVDLSEGMLAVSQRLNPGCEHHHGDMRTVRLGRQFDAVFVHDAVDYMLTEDDLRAAMTTAYVHCRPGGLALFVPDETAETFAPDTDHGGSDDPDGRGARYLSWTWDADADAGDPVIRTEYAFLLREADGSVRAAHETHRTGLFGRDVWLRLLAEVGFEPSTELEHTTEDRSPRELFIGHRPSPPELGASGLDIETERAQKPV